MPQLRQVVLWGLCDGASAASFYAAGDPRVRGVVLLNPWVRGEQTHARSLLFNYYVARLFNRQAWRALVGQRSKLSAALKSVLMTARRALANEPPTQHSASGTTAAGSSVPLLARVASGLERFHGAILLVISGTDLTGAEFVQGIARHRGLRRRMAKPDVTRKVLEVADHTFSTRAWREQVAHWTCEWLEALSPVSSDPPMTTDRA
jgi:pimeloyl-ACP methyl ester carboxylesterase